MKQKKQNPLFLLIKQTWEEMLRTNQKLWSSLRDIVVGAYDKMWQLQLIFPLIFFLAVGLFFFPSLYIEGHIVHSDLDFGFQQGYLFRVFPIWNDLWSTPNFFNMTRIFFLLPLSLLSWVFQLSPSLWEKGIIFLLLYLSSLSMYALLRSLFREDRRLGRWKGPAPLLYISALLGGVFYAYNPYPVIRIQHLFLLVGYSLLPLAFLCSVKLTERFLTKKSATIPLFLMGFSLLWIMASGAIHYLVFIGLICGAWFAYRIGRYIGQRRWERVKILLLRGGLSVGFLLLLLSFFLLPYLHGSQYGSINPPNINSVDSVDMTSRNNLPHLVLYLISYWWGLLDFQTLPLLFWLGGGILFAVMSVAVLFKIHNKFVLFSTIGAGITFFLSLGTKGWASLYLYLVFHNPLAHTLGFIFRDSNKFVGLLAFFFAILLGYGCLSLLSWIYRLYQNQKRTKAKWLSNTFNYFAGLGLGSLVLMGLALHWYFTPLHQLYFKHLYAPVSIPHSFTKAQKYLGDQEQDPYKRHFSFPRYELLVSPGYGYCVATWNARSLEGMPPRATSSQDVWSLPGRMYHNQEGSTVYWNMLHDYFFDMVRHGKSHRLGTLLRKLSVDHLIFHQDILGWEEDLQKSLQTLEKQHHLQKAANAQTGFFDLYQVDSLPWAHLYQRKILSFGGLDILDSLLHFPPLSDDKTGLSFGTQNLKSADLSSLQPGDILQAHHQKDVLLGQLPAQYYLSPFDATEHGNPSYQWSKLRTDTSDWHWQLKAIGIQSPKRPFDFGKGVAYTFVPQMIDMAPYEDFYKAGSPYHFPESDKKHQSFFHSDVPLVLNIQEGYEDRLDQIPSVFGKNIAGESEYWRVAKTRRFPIKANNGYFFEMALSGEKTHLIHAKVKFFDAAEEEVGIAYVSAPKEVESFNFIKFKGLYVTPPETETFQVEILTFQNPDFKSSWKLHQFTMLDLQEKMKPNNLPFTFTPESAENHHLFLRTFENHKGGRIKIITKDQEKIIATHHEKQNQFTWTEGGTYPLEKGKPFVFDIQNIEGFNALNLIAIVPESKLQEAKTRLNEKLPTLHQLLLWETDTDFERFGHKQIPDPNPLFSNGKTIQLNQGFLKNTFEILREDQYQLHLRTQTFDKLGEEKSLTIVIQEKEGKIQYQKTITLHQPTRKLDWITLPPTRLSPGEYQMTISFADETKSLISPSSFDHWQKDDFVFTLSEEENTPKDCTPFIQISPKRHLLHTATPQNLEAKIFPSPSCDWLSLVSKPLDVRPDEHYFLRFGLSAESQNLLHSKILFFDRNRRFIESIVIGAPEKESFPSYLTEKIIEVPPRSRFMQMQFLSRAHPARPGSWNVKNMSFKKIEDFPMVDLVALTPSWPELGEHPRVTQIEKKWLGYDMTITPPKGSTNSTYTLQIGDSFSPLWVIQDGDHIIEPQIATGVLNSYPLSFEDDTPRTISYRLRIRHSFLIGLGITLLTLIGMIVLGIQRLKMKK